jgi:hypothetical protein
MLTDYKTAAGKQHLDMHSSNTSTIGCLNNSMPHDIMSLSALTSGTSSCFNLLPLSASTKSAASEATQQQHQRALQQT